MKRDLLDTVVDVALGLFLVMFVVTLTLDIFGVLK